MKARLWAVGGALERDIGSASFQRRGFYVRLTDGQGRVGHGEATPLRTDGALPDASDLQQELTSAVSLCPGPDPTADGVERAALAVIDRLDLTAPWRSAFQVALESALLTIAAQRRGVEPPDVLCGGTAFRGPLTINALVTGGAVSMVDAVKRASERGIDTIKAKLEPHRVTSQQRLSELAALREVIGNAVGLRLDIGGAWTTSELDRFAPALHALQLELVEQPVAADALSRLGRYAFPWFADESTADPEATARLIQPSHPCAGVVLKPVQVGGLVAAFRLGRAAKRARKQVIVTHALDGSLGLAAARWLARALCPLPLACGLDAHPALSLFPPIPERSA